MCLCFLRPVVDHRLSDLSLRNQEYILNLNRPLACTCASLPTKHAKNLARGQQNVIWIESFLIKLLNRRFSYLYSFKIRFIVYRKWLTKLCDNIIKKSSISEGSRISPRWSVQLSGEGGGGNKRFCPLLDVNYILSQFYLAFKIERITT